MVKYEVYEDNGGGLYLCILDDSGQCKRIFENWEYGPSGILRDAIHQLEEDESSFESWDGDLIERLFSIEGMKTSAQFIYDEGLGDLIAYNGFISSNMGYNGRTALGIKEDD